MVIKILKGAMIGVANIIPGLSGGTIAVIMNIYDKLIDAIDMLFKDPIKSIKSIWQYIVGVILGLLISVICISYLLTNFEIETTSLFVGFIIGALPIVINKIKNQKFKKIDIIIFCVMMLLVMVFPILSKLGLKAVANTNPIIMLLVGIVAAGTMVVPGVSGSMVLITIGYYDEITKLVSETIKSAISFNLNELFSNCIILLPFGIGVLVGIVVIAKLIKILLEKHNRTVYWAILGLVVASPFAIITSLNLAGADFKTIIISIITLLIGYKVANLLCKIDNKEEVK